MYKNELTLSKERGGHFLFLIGKQLLFLKIFPPLNSVPATALETNYCNILYIFEYHKYTMPYIYG